MGRRSKKDRPPAIIQSVLADNVRRLRNRKYAALPHETAMNRALARDAGTVLAQIQRILNLELSPGVDMVEQLAGALEVTPAALLTPYYANTQSNGDESPFNPPSQSANHRSRKSA